MENVGVVFEKKYRNTNTDMRGTYNTLQIDSIYLRQKIRRWAGRTISSTNQIIQTMAPLTLKKCLETGLTIPPKYKRQGMLVRAVIEKLCPALAEMKLLNGTPCQNIRINNFFKFYPLIEEMAKKGIRKISQKLLNKTVLVDSSLTYNQVNWFSKYLNNMGRKITVFQCVNQCQNTK